MLIKDKYTTAAAASVDFVDQMTKIYEEEPDLYNYLMRDLCPCNTGILGKRLVILDYGSVGEAWPQI